MIGSAHRTQSVSNARRRFIELIVVAGPGLGSGYALYKVSSLPFDPLLILVHLYLT
jgi:hypothetical protein